MTAAGSTPGAETPAEAGGGSEDLSALCARLANPIRARLRGRNDLYPCLAEDLAHAVLPVVLATLAEAEAERDQLAKRIPYCEGETEEQYLERQVARWRSETYQARRMAKAAEKRAETAEAVLAEVKRLCDMTIAASCRVQAIEQAEDTLAAIARVEASHG